MVKNIIRLKELPVAKVYLLKSENEWAAGYFMWKKQD